MSNSVSAGIKPEEFDLNVDFYTYMKRIYGNDFNIKNKLDDIIKILEKNLSFDDIRDKFIEFLESNLTQKKSEEYKRLSLLWENSKEKDLFLLACYLIKLKDLATPNLKAALQSLKPKGHPLSLEYDNESSRNAYSTRTMFAIMSADLIEAIRNGEITKILKVDSTQSKKMKSLLKSAEGINVDVSSCLNLIMSESASQSIVSTAGGSYEDRIAETLNMIGIKDFERFDHEEIGSIEHDFKFSHNSHSFGISAKRTLRERYKQYVNLVESSEVDFNLCITLGTDLTKNKAETMRRHGVFVFVSAEVYDEDEDLQNIYGIYSTSEFTKKTLNKLIKS